jgi:hypothetical protein
MSNSLNKLFAILAVASLTILGGPPLSADQIAVSQFKYLNSNDNSTVIEPDEAQDLLNIDITPSGKSVKKRAGYGLYKTVFSPSTGVHGGFHSYDSTGNDIQIWASSVSVKGVVADGTPVTIVSSMTLNSTLDCADTQGFSYCVDSNRDFYIKTTGAALTQWFTTPLGTMVEATPDRVVVAGVSASPNTLFFSQSNTFTNFTVGAAATDAFTEVIAAPGSKLTHIRWGCQKLLWWKDQSFGYFDFEDQFAAQVKTVSDNIGSVDNTSAIDPGGNVWFRGQDGHTYRYDCSSLEKMTIDITPQIQSAGRRTSNSWTQTSQSDFAAGGIGFNGPTVALSTAVLSGSVVPSTISFVDTSSSDFGQGTFSAGLDTTSVSGAFTLKTYLNDTFSGMTNWTQRCGTVGTGSGYADLNAAANTFEQVASSSPTGDYIVQFSFTATGASPLSQSLQVMVSTTTGLADANVGYYVSIKAVASGSLFVVVLGSTSNAGAGFWNDGSGTCNSPGVLIGSSGVPAVIISSFSVAYDTSNHTLKWTRDNTTGAMSLYLDGTLKTTANNTSLNVFKKLYVAGQSGGAFHWYLDDLYFIARQGNLTSRQFDTAFSTPVWGTFTANTSGTGSFAYATRTSADGSSYTADTAVTSGDKITSSTRRYLLYSSTLTTTQVTSLPQVTDVTILAASTGTYYSAVKNAPTINTWSTFNPTYIDNGGSHTFYMRSSSNTFDVLSPTPTWTAQTANAQVVVTTYTYFQVRDDFYLGSATNTPTLNDFTLNWFEGSASDQAYMLYFDNAIWESVAYGAGVSSNTYIFRYDLINDGWGLYNFGAGGMLNQGNRLYFGSVGDGSVYLFGSGTSDAGSSINAYWKSKDFTGSDPFLQSQLTQIDTFAKKNQGATLTSTYTLDTSTSSTFTINLSSTTQSVIQSRRQLPSGKLGYTVNVQYGDTSASSAWELLGFRLGLTPQPYRPGN